MVESYVLLLAVLMLGLFLASISMPRLRGIIRLCASMMFLAAAMVVYSNWRHAPPQVFIVSQSLLVVGFALLDDTIARFLELRHTERWVDVVLLMIVVGFSSYSMATHMSMTGRAEVLISVLAFQSIRSGILLLHKAPVTLKLPARFLAGSFFLFAFFCVARMIVPLMRGQMLGLPGDQEGLMMDGVARLSKVVLLCASVAFGYLWMAALQLSTELDALSLTDPLTSALNRRGLEERLSRELKRASINGGRIALIALDVDHFKTINDRYGHPAGDAVLAAFAKALSQMLRPADSLGRFGGEEFVAVLPNTDEEGARLVAERLRDALRGLSFDFDEGLRLTASFGVAICEPGEDDQAALRRCDKALYAAKQAGRNCVVRFSSLGLAE